MKRKFILGMAVVLMIVALFAFVVMPAMSPGIGVAVAGESSLVGAMELAVMDSEAALIIDNAVPVSAPIAEISMWLALGAILLATSIAYRRGLTRLLNLTIMSLRRLSDSTNEGTKTAGGPNKFILPAAA